MRAKRKMLSTDRPRDSGTDCQTVGNVAMAFPDLQRVTTTKMEMQERSEEVQPAMALGWGSPLSGGRRRRRRRR